MGLNKKMICLYVLSTCLFYMYLYTLAKYLYVEYLPVLDPYLKAVEIKWKQ